MRNSLIKSKEKREWEREREKKNNNNASRSKMAINSSASLKCHSASSPSLLPPLLPPPLGRPWFLLLLPTAECVLGNSFYHPCVGFNRWYFFLTSVWFPRFCRLCQSGCMTNLPPAFKPTCLTLCLSYLSASLPSLPVCLPACLLAYLPRTLPISVGLTS